MTEGQRSVIRKRMPRQVDTCFLWRVLRESLGLMCLFAVVAAGLLGVYRYISADPCYTVEMKFLVNTVSTKRDPDTGAYCTVTNYGDVSGASNLARNTCTLLREDYALDRIHSILISRDERYQAYKDTAIRDLMTVSADSQILTVTVASTERSVALDVARAVEETVPAVVAHYFSIEHVVGAESVGGEAKALANLGEEPDGIEILYRGRRVPLFAFLGFLLGAAIAYLFGFVRAYYDRTVYSAEDLKAFFDLPILGRIPVWSGRRRRRPRKGSNLRHPGCLLTPQTSIGIKTAYELLRTNLDYRTDGACAVYGFASDRVGAGASVTAANTAISFARMNKRVLLIDADLRCPTLQTLFRRDPAGGGLSDLLAGVCPPENVPLRSGVSDRLHLMTCGRIPSNPAELLASERFGELIASARARYDVVLVDLPPLGEVNDAAIPSRHLSGYVLVARAGCSDLDRLKTACETLEGLSSSLVGWVLCDADQRH
ncbi:MAG: polysaccharide biosynthesis tyrosine autokinase [Clostridia bacterium]|nr:polysaccharide biosynthesis tyrosine autokinase [Clostridia bacterium]